MLPPRIKPARVLAQVTVIAFGFWATAVFGAREEVLFDVTVTIPTHEFYVVPVNPAFVENEQQMKWNMGNETLEPLRADFDLHSSSGPVRARLGYDPTLGSLHNSIALKVIFNGHVLVLGDTVVATQSEALPGLRVPLRIEAVKPDGGFKPGEYYGAVLILFDSPIPDA